MINLSSMVLQAVCQVDVMGSHICEPCIIITWLVAQVTWYVVVIKFDVRSLRLCLDLTSERSLGDGSPTATPSVPTSSSTPICVPLPLPSLLWKSESGLNDRCSPEISQCHCRRRPPAGYEQISGCLSLWCLRFGVTYLGWGYDLDCCILLIAWLQKSCA